jgi:hypothetical protein
MANPISVRLDDDVREILEEDAEEQHIGLGTYLRQLASAHAEVVWKARVRAESKRIGELCAVDPKAQAFYDELGTPLNDFFGNGTPPAVVQPIERHEQIAA